MSVNERKVLYYNMDEKVLTPYISKVESQISSIKHIDLQKTDRLRNVEADLIIVSSPLGGEELVRWIKRLIEDQKNVDKCTLSPMIFVTDTQFSEIESMIWECFSDTNWYFDIVNRDNLDFLSMRIAFLLKVSDQLREIKEYDERIAELSDKLSYLEDTMKTLNLKNST